MVTQSCSRAQRIFASPPDSASLRLLFHSESRLHAHRSASLWESAAPVAFVLLWSTGFIGAKIGLRYAEPFTFLLWRFALAAALLILIALATRSRWPTRLSEYTHIAVAGALVHGVYLGSVYAAIDLGINAGIAAVVVGAQPLVTAALVGPMLGERVKSRQWLGFVVGFTGVVMVLWQSIDVTGTDARGFSLTLLALLAITLGTLYQKKFCSNMDLRSGSFIQYVAATLMMARLAAALETGDIVWSGEFVFALAWLVLVLSIGAVTLLWILVRRGAAARVTSLFYLVPPVVAIMGFGLFDERLTAIAIGGIGLTAVGVALVNR